jgi:hypothetical protein
MIYFGVFVAFLIGLAVGFKLAQVNMQPVLDDYDRLLRREALALLRGPQAVRVAPPESHVG